MIFSVRDPFFIRDLNKNVKKYFKNTHFKLFFYCNCVISLIYDIKNYKQTNATSVLY